MAARAKSPERQAQEDFLGSAFRVEDLIAINLPPDVRQRSRFLAGGRLQRRYTLEIETEPVLHDLSEARMGRGPAEKIAELASEKLRASGQQASRATQKWRQWAYRRMTGAVTSRPTGGGDPDGMLRARYSGGRTGEKLPDPNSTTYGVDSGRLADGMFARLNETSRIEADASYRTDTQRSTWTINVPANRLDRSTWMGDALSFDAWLAKFREIIDLAGIVASPEFENELYYGLQRAIGKLEAEQWRLRRQMLAQLWGVVRSGARLMAVI